MYIQYEQYLTPKKRKIQIGILLKDPANRLLKDSNDFSD